MAGSDQAFLRPKKSLGQNFLQDRNICRKIVDALAIKQGDVVVEIGPGRGALTEFILEHECSIHLIEYDRDLVAHWRSFAENQPSLSVHEADVLDFDLTDLAGGRSLKIIGNLPYNISSPILFHLLEHIDVVDHAVVMLQKELVERMAASSGNKLYGRLSVMLQQAFKIEHLFNVSASSFFPPPKVESAIARLTPLSGSRPQLQNSDHFAQIVKQSFATRRKTIRNNLKGLLSSEELEQLGIDPGCRAETLDVDAFIQMADFYSLKEQ